jgi:hypothetical protein
MAEHNDQGNGEITRSVRDTGDDFIVDYISGHLIYEQRTWFYVEDSFRWHIQFGAGENLSDRLQRRRGLRLPFYWKELMMAFSRAFSGRSQRTKRILGRSLIGAVIGHH